MRHRLFLAICAPIILLLAGCVSTRQAGGVYVTDSKQVNLLPTSCMDGGIDSMCYLSGSYGEQTFSLGTYTYADGNTISMTIMTMMGNTIATLTYEGNTITKANSTLVGIPFPGEYLFFDFQLCYYQADALKRALGEAGLDFTEEESEGVRVRKLFDGNQLLVTIQRSGNIVTLENHLRGYSYRIEESVDG